VARLAEAFGGPLLTGGLLRASERQSHLETWGQLALSLGLAWDITPPWFAADPGRLPAGVAAWIDDVRSRRRPIWVVHPGGRLPTKRWPVGHFRKVLEDLFAAEGSAVIVVSPSGEESPHPIGVGQLAVETPTHASLAAVLSVADFVLCNDSYAGHVAAALGKPTFAIFGSGEPDWFAPSGNRARAIPGAACPHRPCIDRCVFSTPRCLVDLSPAEVAGALRAGGARF